MFDKGRGVSEIAVMSNTYLAGEDGMNSTHKAPEVDSQPERVRRE